MADIIVVSQQPPASGNQPKTQAVAVNGQDVPPLLNIPPIPATN